MTLLDIAKRAEKITVDNSPQILTGIAVVGVVGTAYLTGKATIKALDLITEEQRLLDLEQQSHPLEPMEKFKLTWLVFVPPVIAGGLTIVCIVGANRIGSRRAAAVAAAYTLSEKAFTEYREKIEEKVGEKREQKYRDEIAQDRVNANPPTDIYVTAGGDVLCMDSMSGRFFQSSIETLRRAEAQVNLQIMSDNYASLTDFYDRIGLAGTAYSTEVGWNLDKSLELEFSTVLAENDKPCIYVGYHTAPIRDYHRLH